MNNKRKIALVGFTKIKYMPYLHFYLNMIPKDKYEIHLVYWKRDFNEDQTIDKAVLLHGYEKKMEDTISIIKKIPSILSFGIYAKKVLEEINPDALIVMHSTTAMTIFSTLVSKFRNKYIFDYRDITYERFFIYKKLVGEIVKSSFITFTSSDDFRRYLPINMNDKIYTSHNLLKNSLKKVSDYRRKNKHESTRPIRIGFWGLIRHTEYNKQIIKQFGNDNRFELYYYGRATGEDLALLIESQKRYNNIFFFGEYLPEERDQFSKEIDLIHNLYSNEDATMPHAMGNKFYDGLIYGIPQLCTKDSYMGRLCSKFEIGLECNPYDVDFKDKIIVYYQKLNLQHFQSCCDKLLQEIVADVERGEQKVYEFM